MGMMWWVRNEGRRIIFFFKCMPHFHSLLECAFGPQGRHYNIYACEEESPCLVSISCVMQQHTLHSLVCILCHQYI